jgi:hypothetical protein
MIFYTKIFWNSEGPPSVAADTSGEAAGAAAEFAAVSEAHAVSVAVTEIKSTNFQMFSFFIFPSKKNLSTFFLSVPSMQLKNLFVISCLIINQFDLSVSYFI